MNEDNKNMMNQVMTWLVRDIEQETIRSAFIHANNYLILREMVLESGALMRPFNASAMLQTQKSSAAASYLVYKFGTNIREKDIL